MRSSDAKYYPGLDHLRALAAFMVFTWHFTHGTEGMPIPFGPVYGFWTAPFNEGHCGVSLFLCLSGYIFAKLLADRTVIWGSFYWNRFLRLFPLLAVVLLIAAAPIVYADPGLLGSVGLTIAEGLIVPVWPAGCWSVTVEIQFYALLPVILQLKQRWQYSPYFFLILSLLLRVALWLGGADVFHFAYWTIIGRLDQLVLGIIAWEQRHFLRVRPSIFGVVAVAFCLYFQWFTTLGGFHDSQDNRLLWVFEPLVEGMFFAFLVAFYDGLAVKRTWYWAVIERIGAASYSLYLLGTLFVFNYVPRLLELVPGGVHSWFFAEFLGTLCFLAFAPFAWLVYRWYEMPILRFRKPYIMRPPTVSAGIVVPARLVSTGTSSVMAASRPSMALRPPEKHL